MINDRIEQQIHGYRNGHQLLGSTLKLSRVDQDAVERLSDISGPLHPGEHFLPYVTSYPLPSRSHYVVARTWQDTDAARAGCVITRSLLIPMGLWEVVENIAGIFALLTPVERGRKVDALELGAIHQPLPVVRDSRSIELVEALFLDSRQPIVLFDASDAETMTLRVLTALWPSLRRNFAACTYALTPRRIDGRHFDLVFAPKSARTRFAEWQGRRIGTNSSKSPHHRWAATIDEQVFRSDMPNLMANDTLGLLTSETRADDSVLRLSFLWNELAAKAETMPTAVLGMLDILSSQRVNTPEVLDKLSPRVARAAEMAGEVLPQREAWSFLTALVGKFPVLAPSKSVLKKIEQSAAGLAKRDSEAAFSFLEAEVHSGRTIPSVILAGLGKGLGSPSYMSSWPTRFARLPPDVGLSLFALSAGFARSAVAMAKSDPSYWLSCLIRLFEVPDRDMKRKARRRLAALIDDESLAPLLPPALDGATGRELVHLANGIGRRTNFETSAFDEPLGNAATSTASLEALRNAIATGFEGEGADRFLLSTLRLEGADVAWLNDGALKKNRSRRILLRLLEESADRTLLSVLREEKNREIILSKLLEEPDVCAGQLVRILALGEMDINSYLEIGHRLLPLVEPEESGRLVDQLLERALAEAEPGDERVPMLVARAGTRTYSRQLIQMATIMGASPERIADNILMLDAAPANVRTSVVAHIDELSDRLMRLRPEDLGEAAYIAWGKMITDAGNVDQEVQLRAAMPTLAFALRLVKLPVSPLIIASFPVVYAQLLKSKGEEDFKTFPALMTLPWHFFVDWDRAKAARRDLVDAFLKSCWPPADLLLAALAAGIDQKILRRVSRKYEGNHYVAEIERDGQRLETSARKRVLKSISIFRSGVIDDDWD